MTDDPFQELRRDLVDARRRQIDARLRGTGRHRSRRALFAASAALLVAAPATAAITGVSPFGSGSTPDGSTYTTQDFVAEGDGTTAGPDKGAKCRRVDFRDQSGDATTRSTACRPGSSPGPGADKALAVSFMVAPGNSLLVQGSVSSSVARVTVSGVDGEIALAPDDNGRRKFSVTTTQHRPTVTALDASGQVVSRYDVPL